MNPSFHRVNTSASSHTAKMKVKRDEVLLRMVLEVTLQGAEGQEGRHPRWRETIIKSRPEQDLQRQQSRPGSTALFRCTESQELPAQRAPLRT